MEQQKDNYVIWVEFDDEFMNFLNEKCNELDANGIASGFRPPHLTMTFVEDCDEEKLIQFTKEFFLKKQLNLNISMIGKFSGGFLLYVPKVTDELLKYHREYCEGVSEFGDLAWDLYVPGNWTPHIALTGALSEEDAITAFYILQKNFSGAEVSMKKIAIRKNGELLAEFEV